MKNHLNTYVSVSGIIRFNTMKILAVLFLVGFALAAASPVPVIETLFRNEVDEFLDEGKINTEEAGNLQEKFDQLVKRLDVVIEEIKNKKYNAADLLVEMGELSRLMKEKFLPFSEEARESIDRLQKNAQGTLKKILSRISRDDTGKWSVGESELLSPNDPRLDVVDLLTAFRRLKMLIKERYNAEDIKEKIEELFGKGSEFTTTFFDMFKEKSEKTKQKLLTFIDDVLGEEEEVNSIRDYFDQVKDWFKDLNIDLKEKFVKFGAWAKTQYEKEFEKGKDTLTNIKLIAKKFLEDTKDMGEEIAYEALEFFREYKEDLGNVYDEIKEKVKDIAKKDN